MSNQDITDDLRTHTIAEVMERTQFSRKTIQRMLDRGELKTLGRRGVGRPVWITHASLKQLFEEADAR